VRFKVLQLDKDTEIRVVCYTDDDLKDDVNLDPAHGCPRVVEDARQGSRREVEHMQTGTFHLEDGTEVPYVIFSDEDVEEAGPQEEDAREPVAS
jgi:hypothetical protein